MKLIRSPAAAPTDPLGVPRVSRRSGQAVGELIVALCLAYFTERQPFPSEPMRRLLHQCTGLFPATTAFAAVEYGEPWRTPYRPDKAGKPWERWEEWVSRLASLAFHMYLVQSCYGVKRPETAEACRALIGMEAARDFLLAHIDCSRQPERFLEGLAVLELCGTSTEDRLAQWYGRMRATPKHVYPESLQPLFDGPHAQPHCNTSQALGDIVHMYRRPTPPLLQLALTRHGIKAFPCPWFSHSALFAASLRMKIAGFKCPQNVFSNSTKQQLAGEQLRSFTTASAAP
jgi:hypothetical protein